MEAFQHVRSRRFAEVGSQADDEIVTLPHRVTTKIGTGDGPLPRSMISISRIPSMHRPARMTSARALQRVLAVLELPAIQFSPCS